MHSILSVSLCFERRSVAWWILAVSVFSGSMIGLCSAQAAVAESVDAGRLTFDRPAQSAWLETLDPSPGPSPQTPRSTPLPGELDKRSFLLTEIRLDGMTVFAKEDVLPLWQERLGKDATVGDLYRIAEALTGRYQRKGYPIVKIWPPKQTIRDGVATLRVVEARVQRTDVEGKIPEDFRRHVERKVAGFIGSPLSMPLLEQYLLDWNRAAGMRFRANILRDPQSTEAGAILLKLEAQTEKFGSGAEVFYHHSPYFTPFYTVARTGAYHQWVAGDRWMIEGSFRSPASSGVSLHGSYVRPIDDDHRFTWELDAQRQESNPQKKARPLLIEGEYTALRTGVNDRILETRKRRVDLGLAVEHIEHESSMLRHRLFQDRITVLHQNATFGMGSLMDRTRHQLQITQSHGVPLTSSRPAALRSRAIGSHHFHSVTGQWQTDHQLGKRGYILSRTLGKWSDRPLLSSQMMGFGGWQMGRGMPSSAVSGDRILMTHLEAGYRFRTPWGLGWSPSVFYDTAYRWTWPAEYPTPLRQGATTGVALATQLPYNVNLSLSLGVPVIKHHDKNLFEWRGTKTYLYVGVRW